MCVCLMCTYLFDRNGLEERNSNEAVEECDTEFDETESVAVGFDS